MFTVFNNIMSEKKYLIFLAFVCLFWFAGIFYNFRYTATPDWDECLTHQELQRKIVFEYHQLPLWNPYVCGGEPWFAHPESSFLSFHFILVLIFGTVAGVNLSILALTFIGVAGIYSLCRFFNLKPAFSIISSIFSLILFNFLVFYNPFPCFYIALTPWIYLLFNHYKLNRRHLVVIACLLAYLIYAGGYYSFIFTFTLLCIDAICYAVLKKDASIFASLFKIGVLTFLLASLKLIPMLELLTHYPRIQILPRLQGWLLDPTKILGFRDHLHIFNKVIGNPLLLTILILFFLSLLLFKSHPTLVVMNVFFMFLVLGDHSPINIWRIWHYCFPSFHKNHEIFIMPLFISLSVCVGLIAQQLLESIRKYWKIGYSGLLLFILFLSYHIFTNAWKTFEKRPPLIYRFSESKQLFTQTKGDPDKMFDTVSNNQGAVQGYDAIGRQIKTEVIFQEDRRYQGEFYLKQGSGEIRSFTFTPEILTFYVNTKSSDVIVINQNYFPGWRSNLGKVINYRGLLAVPITRADTQMVMYYLPLSFIFGIVILLLTLAGLSNSRIRVKLLG